MPAGYYAKPDSWQMTSLEVTFRNSIDDDLNIESWISTSSNFISESSNKRDLSDLTRTSKKADKRKVMDKIKGSFCKSRKAVCRKLHDSYKENADISGGGRASLILKKR